jgi:hypothetical protein
MGNLKSNEVNRILWMFDMGKPTHAEAQRTQRWRGGLTNASMILLRFLRLLCASA